MLTIYIDDELKNKAKSMGINISAFLREQLTWKINYLQGNKTKMSKERIIKEINIRKAKVEPQLKEIKHLEQELNELQKIEHDEELQKIDEEQKRIESLSKCVNCGNELSAKSKFHSFKKGKICQSCWLSADSDSIRRWNDVSS